MYDLVIIGRQLPSGACRSVGGRAGCGSLVWVVDCAVQENPVHVLRKANSPWGWLMGKERVGGCAGLNNKVEE